MPVVIYSITKANCAVYFYDCQLYQVSISTTTYTIYILSEYIYYTYAIFVIGKDLPFQSPSRLINRKKIHCKCCIRQGLVICMLNRPELHFISHHAICTAPLISITRHLGKLSRLVAEEDVSGVEERLGQIKTSFGQFEETHDAYHNLLTENNDIVASEEWFWNIEASYIDGVKTAKHWLSSLNNSINVKPVGHDEPVVDVAKLIALMSVPKLEIDKFSRDLQFLMRLLTL